jgi:hypothetical protein
MSTKIELFEKAELLTSDKIICKINKGEWNDIFKGLCNINDNGIVLDYIYFKHFATKSTYNIIINYITANIDTILLKNESFIAYINLAKLTLSDVEKHKEFIKDLSVFLKSKYPDKLTKCYIHNAPFVFSQIFNIVSLFIDKDTQKKIEVVKT